MRIVDKLSDNSDNLVTLDEFADDYYTYHGRQWTNYFEKALTNLEILLSLKDGIERDLIIEIITLYEPIIKATPTLIPDIITHLTTGVYQNILSENLQFRKEIEEAFDYKSFRTSAKASWYAQKFSIKACLYCNAQFTLAVGKDGTKRKLLFQFDHFYNKSTYPFLSLTLGNLIPSCSSCNISKSRSTFSIASHVHPFIEDTNTKFVFYINQENALEYLLGKNDYNLLAPEIFFYDNKFKDQSIVFNIESIYKKHVDIVEELVLKSIYYNKSRKDELEKEFLSLNLSQDIINRFILGNYSLDSEINRRPLAKLTIDIAKQLKLIR